ncbi:hypothetical protein J5226_23890 [Lysobacter sp. K5869]|uniref:hypothetical protein n=1 Tax=Lysobacter sp. K5869 TaxID=2820808 RepID=UPI001C062800|nr:hypothetical protein [Lysobacter sp. K5869]QWP76583.1 hypothetical protein J5226_23890 [Lysobacter sp. K5869]
MSVIALILLVLGIVVSLVAGIWLLVVAFRENVWWGLGSLLLSPVALVFVILHWQQAKKPFLINLGGLALVIAGALLSQGQSAGATGY